MVPHVLLATMLALLLLCPGDMAGAAPTSARLGRGSGARHAMASWYGAWHEGRRMANGCAFRAGSLSAASRTLPLGAWLRVRNAGNGRAIIVRVLDRGPYVRGRDLDLSRAAAKRLGMLQAGLARVDITLLRITPIRRCH